MLDRCEKYGYVENVDRSARKELTKVKKPLDVDKDKSAHTRVFPEVRCEHTEMVSVADLKPNPRNPNKHPKKQVRILSENIAQYGWRHPIVVSRRSGLIVSGHGRLAAAKLLKVEKVPVDFQDYDSDADELAVLLSDNLIPELAQLDMEVVKELDFELRELDVDVGPIGLKSEKLPDIDIDIDDDDDNGDKEEEEEESTRGIYEFSETAIFSSSNIWGIPDFLSDKLAKSWPTDVWNGRPDDDIENKLLLWGTNKFPEDCSKSYLGFYVDDYRFESIWLDAVKTVNKLHKNKFHAIIEPDFSLWRDDPLACQIWNRYRSRWIARYWQEVGFNVIPNLSFSTEESWGFCFETIPLGCPVVSVQLRTMRDKKGQIHGRDGLNKALDVIKPENLLLYGGQEHKGWFLDNVEYGKTNIIWLGNFRSKMANKENKNE